MQLKNTFYYGIMKTGYVFTFTNILHVHVFSLSIVYVFCRLLKQRSSCYKYFPILGEPGEILVNLHRCYKLTV